MCSAFDFTRLFFHSFPLLLTRNAKVDLDDFESKNHVRVMSPERVLKVAALSKRVCELDARVAAYFAENDSDEEITFLDDDVFDPFRQSYNKKRYSAIRRLCKTNRL